MDAIRILLLAGAMGTTMVEAIHLGARSERALAVTPSPAALAEAPEIEPDDFLDELLDEEPTPELPIGIEAPFNPVVVDIDLGQDAALFPAHDDIMLDDGARIGPMAFDPYEEVLSSIRPAPRRHPFGPVGPRLHSDPGIHSILTARRIIASNEIIEGSCYYYLSEVYARAGHHSWRKRRIVYRAGRDGPYADMSLIRPGDWLYIVNDPGRTPVGTHSVMFVSWNDRGRGYGSVISHPGWGAHSSGRQSTYDLSRTYRIIRPTN